MQLPSPAAIATQVAQALDEDIGEGDLTAALVPPAQQVEARLVARENAVLCGAAWFDEVFRQLDPAVVVEWRAADGDRLVAGQEVCRLQGAARAILTGERTAMNFLQTLSGTATVTARHVAEVAGTGARILDTRKTIPGLRHAQKYAVSCGGGDNHRVGLFDAVLIKENHIAAAGSIAAAVATAREAGRGNWVEVEVENLDELRQALAAGAERVLLDNFDLGALREAVDIASGKARLEASGGLELDRLREIAATGVDDISVGALTKHVAAVDYSLRVTVQD